MGEFDVGRVAPTTRSSGRTFVHLHRRNSFAWKQDYQSSPAS
jgi:hypothetical protein